MPKRRAPGRQSKKSAPRVSTRIARAARKASLKIRNVLVPIDFSPHSIKALEFALPLVKHFGAGLHLVHVYTREHPMAALAAVPLVMPEAEMSRSAHRRLTNVARKFAIKPPEKNFHVLKGRPFEEICRLARKSSIDLIVIATRGNTGFKHFALGSTAERVVRYSPCPVLVVRQQKKFSAQPPGFRKILVPIDFSECSMKGLAYAQAFAAEFKSTLVLLHSVHFQYFVASDEYARYDLPLLLQQAEQAARERMRDLVRKTDWKGLNVETSLEAGHAGQQVCDGAWGRDVDLIVTSTHGTTGLKHVLLGSTAEYVVRHAACPVLVVPTRPI